MYPVEIVLHRNVTQTSTTCIATSVAPGIHAKINPVPLKCNRQQVKL